MPLTKQEGHTFFSAYNVTSATYVYNADGDSGANDGQFSVEKYSNISIQIGIPTLGSTSIDVRIEGQVKSSDRWATVWSKNYASATTIDELVVVTENLEYLRVGLKVNTNGTDSVNVYGGFRREN
jgi:hypothetical protein